MPANPKVSVCIPVRNGAAHLHETLTSVLNQHFTDFEVVIADNASSDETANILADFATSDSRVKVWRYGDAVGMAENWNRVVSHASGRYVVLLSADDMLLPEFLSVCVRELEAGDCAAVSCEHFLMYGSKLVRRKLRMKPGTYKRFCSLVMLKNPFSINFTLFRAKELASVRRSNKTFFRSLYACDYDLWFRLSLAGHAIKFVETSLGVYRVHENNLSHQRLRMNRHAFLVLAGLRRHLLTNFRWQFGFTVVRLLARHVWIWATTGARDRLLMRSQLGELGGLFRTGGRCRLS